MRLYIAFILTVGIPLLIASWGLRLHRMGRSIWPPILIGLPLGAVILMVAWPKGFAELALRYLLIGVIASLVCPALLLNKKLRG
ncbi:MAG: hypothetical protein QOG33_441 [Gaiellales bacterium]|jgi:hypothetical protein|nr:hypothetical protein [Gaiellales bacterium]